MEERQERDFMNTKANFISSSNTVIFEIQENIAIISINRPESFNALNKEVVDSFAKILEYIEKNEEIRAVVINSKGNFAAGADIKDMVEMNASEALEFAFSQTFNKIADLEVPTIAAIDGYALGGGLELALACDLRIATDRSNLGLPEIKLGIFPGAGGCIRLPWIIGYSKALEMILFGRNITAMEAYEIQLVNKVVGSDDLFNEAISWAKKLTNGPIFAQKSAKKIMKEAMLSFARNTLMNLELQYWSALFETEDQAEGMKAFLEKRRPQFG
jgi:enoyl-CoA hydratase/carnithine racemase